MSDQIQRPVFYEGQILGALDLKAGVEYPRGQLARHERYLHTWGIASGLELTKKPKTLELSGTSFDYFEVSVSPGLAIDGWGREIIVAEAYRLSEDEFDQLNIAITDANALYPVLLIGRDTTAPVSPLGVGDCATAEATRQIEGYEITFRGPGEDLNLESQQPSPGISDGPQGSDVQTWMVLLGFIKWNSTIEKFTDFQTESSGLRPRYAGVLADEVAARNGKLLLRTRAKNESGKPALLLDETDGGELKFGALNAAGVVTPVLTVKANGDVEATGTIKGAFTSGNVYVQSGFASDGVVLPLPPGVKAEDVGPQKGTLHIQVSVRAGGSPPPDAVNQWGAVPLECSVDDDRRVRCRVRWFRPGVANFDDRGGVCDYVVLVAIPATGGAP